MSVSVVRPRNVFLVVTAFFFLPACSANQEQKTPEQEKPSQAGCPYKLPFDRTLGKIRVTQGYAEPGNRSHLQGSKMEYAIDFALSGGTSVLAARAGVVSQIHDRETISGGPESAEYANFVIVNHKDGTFALYQHLQSVAVVKGQEVQQGQLLGKSGNTGWTDGHFHLHFQLQQRGDMFGQSIPLCFQEVDGGVPQLDKSYTSQNHLPGALVLAPAEKPPSISGEVSGVVTLIPQQTDSEDQNSPAGLNREAFRILEQVQRALGSKDLAILEGLLPTEVCAGNGTSDEGVGCHIPRTEFLQEIKVRFVRSNPVCSHYYFGDGGETNASWFSIYTTGWSPEWPNSLDDGGNLEFVFSNAWAVQFDSQSNITGVTSRELRFNNAIWGRTDSGNTPCP